MLGSVFTGRKGKDGFSCSEMDGRCAEAARSLHEATIQVCDNFVV